MEMLFRYVRKGYYCAADLFYEHRILTLLFACGFLIFLCGMLISVYKGIIVERRMLGKKLEYSKLYLVAEKTASLFPLNFLRDNISNRLSFGVFDSKRLAKISTAAALLLPLSSILLALSLQEIGRLWYVKIMVIVLSAILPYYIFSLFLDMYRMRISRHIPAVIDEFRSAFIKWGKVRPALKECSMYIDKGLGRIISSAADSPNIEKSLEDMRDCFENVWFNMLVVLLLNYKENGGELLEQLYRLNKTVTRYGNVEKKKNKRLLWYELFAVSAAVISIPLIIWVNSILLGYDSAAVIDAGSNMIIGRIIAYSIISLIVIRILRRI